MHERVEGGGVGVGGVWEGVGGVWEGVGGAGRQTNFKRFWLMYRILHIIALSDSGEGSF